MNRRIARLILLTLLVTLLTAACQIVLPPATEETQTTVTLVADGTTQTLDVNPNYTVNDVLRLLDLSLGPLDRINPPGYSRIEDGMTITIVRVREETVVTQEVVPFERRTVPNEGLPEGETQLLQAGANGLAEVTYRVTYEDGVEAGRSEVRRVLLETPQDEVIMVGRQSELPTVTVNGTLAYIYNGNAWVMRENSANRRPLTLDGGLDGRVFELSADGGRLLYTRTADAAPEEGEAGPAPFNSLWAVLDTRAEESQPVPLGLDNILFAAWVPGTERTILYSTAEPRESFPGWQANNDLWRGEVTDDGQVVNQVQLVEPWSGGVYGWYGTAYAIAPDGVTLAWAQPDAVGLLLPTYGEEDEEGDGEAEGEPVEPPPDDSTQLPTGYERQTLLAFAPWNAYDFVWVPNPVWSPDGTLLLTLVHGEPLGTEAPEDSPAFPLVALPRDASYSARLVEQAGMWAEPSFSPVAESEQVAYLQSIRPLESVSGRYQLVIMDRDGSNRRILYPAADQPGLAPQPYTWSPDGRQIALVNPGPEGALMLIDTATGLAQQVTEGQTSTPRWAP